MFKGERENGKEKDLRMVGFRQVIKNVEGCQCSVPKLAAQKSNGNFVLGKMIFII